MQFENLSYRELKNECKKLQEEYDDLMDESLKKGDSFEDFFNIAKPIKEKLYFCGKYKRLKQDPTVEFGKEWKGSIFTLEKFINLVNDGMFIDEDGVGYYATETGKSDIMIFPSDILEGLYRKDFTHIIWFNS